MLWVLIRIASVRRLRGRSNKYPQHMFFMEKLPLNYHQITILSVPLQTGEGVVII